MVVSFVILFSKHVLNVCLYINLHSVCVFACVMQLFSIPNRPTLASEVANESS